MKYYPQPRLLLNSISETNEFSPLPSELELEWMRAEVVTGRDHHSLCYYYQLIFFRVINPNPRRNPEIGCGLRNPNPTHPISAIHSPLVS